VVVISQGGAGWQFPVWRGIELDSMDDDSRIHPHQQWECAIGPGQRAAAPVIASPRTMLSIAAEIPRTPR